MDVDLAAAKSKRLIHRSVSLGANLKFKERYVQRDEQD